MWAGVLALVVLTVVAYGPALQAGFVWDDDDYVTANHTLRSLAGLGEIWLRPGAVPQYYPLSFTSLWLDFRMWGTAPFGYHLENVLLHALNAVLAWRVLARLAVPGAWAAAALFALHPVQVESVAWVTERKNVLSAAFYLGSLLTYLRVIEAPRVAWRPYLIALGLFVAAMLSKTVTCTLPVVILLLLVWKRRGVEWREAAPLAPFFAVGGALALVTIWMETHHVGARGVDWQLSPLDRILIAGRALWLYAGKLLWPWPIVFNYPRWRIDAGVWWQHLFPLAAAAGLAGLWLARRRIGTGALVAFLFFAVTLLPALGFVDVFPMRYSFVADHFQYLASLGPIALAAAAATTAVAGRGHEARQVARVGCAVVLLVFGALVWRQSQAYESLETLWADTLEKNPESWMAHNNLGLLLFQRGRIEPAIAHYRSAIRIRPDDAFAHNNLGYALAMEGKGEEALVEIGEAIRIEPDNPEAQNNMGNALVAAGRMDDAIVHYRAAVRSKPGYADAYNNLASALAAQGQRAEAMAGLAEALRIDPNYADAHYNLGVMLAGEGRLAEAVPHYQAAVRLKPGQAQAESALGEALVGVGRPAEAVTHFEAAARLDPGNTAVRDALAALRAGGVPGGPLGNP